MSCLNNMEILASIIIPVYNVEKYIKECLDSIFVYQQISYPIEVIVVDDGSTDRCPDILNEYKKHHEFLLITKDNAGIGCARNTGIDAANGKYLLFMDSDDYFVPGSLDSLLTYLAVSDEDIVEYDYIVYNESNGSPFTKKEISSIDSGPGQKTFAVWEKDGFYRPMVCMRAVSRNMIISNKLYFYPGIFHEDEEWSPKIFAYAESVRYLPLKIYVYRIREGSCTTTKNNKHYNDMLKCVDSLCKFSKTKNLHPEYVKAIRRDTVFLYFYALKKIKLNGDYNVELIRELEKLKEVISFSEDFHRRIIYKYIIDKFGIKIFYIFKYGYKNLRFLQ